MRKVGRKDPETWEDDSIQDCGGRRVRKYQNEGVHIGGEPETIANDLGRVPIAQRESDSEYLNGIPNERVDGR